MNFFAQLGILLRKELLLEWRNGYAISGILLYVLSMVFVVYVSFFQGVSPMVWNTLYWVMVLFATTNAVVKSFVQENGARQLYYYQLADPTAVLVSKIVYNILLLFFLSILTWVAFGFITNNPVRNLEKFLLAIFLGSLGFSILFTFVSALSAKADNNAALLPVLSFPLVLPIIMTLVKISVSALGAIRDSGLGKDIGILIGIDLGLLALALVLFPFLWRD
jgi:heme exporter protein B